MTDQNYSNQKKNPDDKLGIGLQILSFIIPLVGAIIYFANKENSPNKAKSACHAALWGFGIGVAINIIVAVA